MYLVYTLINEKVTLVGKYDTYAAAQDSMVLCGGWIVHNKQN